MSREQSGDESASHLLRSRIPLASLEEFFISRLTARPRWEPFPKPVKSKISDASHLCGINFQLAYVAIVSVGLGSKRTSTSRPKSAVDKIRQSLLCRCIDHQEFAFFVLKDIVGKREAFHFNIELI